MRRGPQGEVRRVQVLAAPRNVNQCDAVRMPNARFDTQPPNFFWGTLRNARVGLAVGGCRCRMG